jgi:hypothetical protein
MEDIPGAHCDVTFTDPDSKFCLVILIRGSEESANDTRAPIRLICVKAGGDWSRRPEQRPLRQTSGRPDHRKTSQNQA